MIGDANELESQFMAAFQENSSFVLYIQLASYVARLRPPRITKSQLRVRPILAVLRRLHLEICLDPTHSLVFAHYVSFVCQKR